MKRKSKKELKGFLERFDIEHAKWGVGPTKSLDELLTEWENGETVFLVERGALVRCVRRVQIRIRYRMPNGQWLVLVETHQEFANGSTRKRNRKWSVVEKRLRHEKAEAAAIRGVRDELGIEVARKRFRPIGKETERVKMTSSYPGLPTRYHSARYDLVLLESEFEEEYEEVQPGRKTTYFSWRKDGDKKRAKKA